MIAFIKANWLTLTGVLIVTLLYLLSKFFPAASAEAWWLHNIATVLGIPLIPLAPALKGSGGE